MAISNGYCTLDELKAHMLSGSQPTTYTPESVANMELAIEAISRLWDSRFNTNFYGVTETRYFTPEWSDLMYIDDLISITTLKTDDDEDGTYETTWSTSDYWLEPKNARAKTDVRDRRPYRQIRIKETGSYTFPTKVAYGVEIAGVWGYTNGIQSGEPTEVPPVVKQGVLLMAHRVYRRKDAIFGVAGTPALGVQIIQARIEQDSDIMSLMHGVDMRGF